MFCFVKICRSSRDVLKGQARKTEPAHCSPILPPTKPTSTDSGKVGYLSDNKRSSSAVPVHSSSKKSFPPPSPTHSSSSDDDFINPTASALAPTPQALNGAAATSKYADPLPLAGNHLLPPPPIRYSQRQQFFKQRDANGGGASSSSSRSSGSSFDSLIGQTKNMSLRSPPGATEQEKSDDALFRDLVEFARAKSSSPRPDRSV